MVLSLSDFLLCFMQVNLLVSTEYMSNSLFGLISFYSTCRPFFSRSLFGVDVCVCEIES
jgi:hypothetical protein